MINFKGFHSIPFDINTLYGLEEIYNVFFLISALKKEGVGESDKILVTGGYADHIANQYIFKNRNKTNLNDFDFFCFKNNQKYLPFSLFDRFHCINYLCKEINGDYYYFIFSSFRECYLDIYEKKFYYTQNYLRTINEKMLYCPYWSKELTIRDFNKKGDNIFKAFVVAYKNNLSISQEYLNFIDKEFQYMKEHNPEGVLASSLMATYSKYFDGNWDIELPNKTLNQLEVRLKLREIMESEDAN